MSARLAQDPVPGNETLAGGFVFCENQTHNQARQPSKACREGWQASLPAPDRVPPQELRVAPAATLAGTGDPVDKAWVQLWPPSLTLFSLE